jgi:hypothetical protein
MKRSVLFIVLLFAFGVTVPTSANAQTKPTPTPRRGPIKITKESLEPQPPGDPQLVKITSAYAELILRQTEVEADLADLLVDYTEEYPKVRELKTESQFLRSEIAAMLRFDPAQASKLTTAYGKLILQKVKITTDLALLREKHKEDHPDVQRALRRLAVYEKAIKDLLK